MKYVSSGKLIRNVMGRSSTLLDQTVTHFHLLPLPGLAVVGIMGENAKGLIRVHTDTVVLEKGLKNLKPGQKVYFHKNKLSPQSHLIVGA